MIVVHSARIADLLLPMPLSPNGRGFRMRNSCPSYCKMGLKCGSRSNHSDPAAWNIEKGSLIIVKTGDTPAAGGMDSSSYSREWPTGNEDGIGAGIFRLGR